MSIKEYDLKSMKDQEHYNSLANMYLASPINEIFKPFISLSEGKAEVEIELEDRYHHSAGAVHGSIYFKMLDDSAFFAANTLEKEYFVLTTSFTTYLTRPVTSGKLKAIGQVVNKNNTQIIAESVVYNSDGKEIGRGNGIFLKSKMLLKDVNCYC